MDPCERAIRPASVLAGVRPALILHQRTLSRWRSGCDDQAALRTADIAGVRRGKTSFFTERWRSHWRTSRTKGEGNVRDDGNVYWRRSRHVRAWRKCDVLRSWQKI